MRKVFAFIPAAIALSAALFAEVTVKDLGGGSAEVTFFYGNPRASEVVVAGDFTDWQNGAWPMEKTEKGFTLTRTFKTTDVLRYKFISDGNWTTDLKAPEFVDDGFGGKNGQVTIADMIGGDASTAAAKINFISWSMIGAQGNYLTQGVEDKTKKGFDFDSAVVAFKSYNKFAGNFLPNCPVYIEIALAETELEDYERNLANGPSGGNLMLAQKNKYNEYDTTWKQGFQNFFNGIFANPVAYLARANDNGSGQEGAGPGSNPFLGHLKFGFNTPWIKYYTGFNYAKMDVRNAITWTTIDGNWDAGYQHVGGFNVFSLGDKPAAMLEELAGIKLDVGFAPNKTGDRKGTEPGVIGWVNLGNDMFNVDVQVNGMYHDYLFYDPVEHDIVVGAKMPQIDIGDGKLYWALQALISTHQKSSDDIVADGASNTTDYFGYSTDVFYRSGDFDGIKNLAGNVRLGYKMDLFNVDLEYRLRGAQASMLFLRENHDDGTFDLSEQLGNINTQRVALNAGLNLLDGALGINLGFDAEMALQSIDKNDDFYKGYIANAQSWYLNRCGDFVKPHLGISGGAEIGINPAITYNITDNISVGAYADMDIQAFSYTDGVDADEANKYAQVDSPFRLKVAGASFGMKPDSDVVKGVNVWYGFDLSNEVRMLNTLIGQVQFPYDITVSLALALKTENTFSKYEFNSDENNPFGIAIGISHKMKMLKKPVVYAQFCFNTDPFAHFGDGQDNLRLNRSNIRSTFANEGDGLIDAVDIYDGRAAMRVGIRWDI